MKALGILKKSFFLLKIKQNFCFCFLEKYHDCKLPNLYPFKA